MFSDDCGEETWSRYAACDLSASWGSRNSSYPGFRTFSTCFLGGIFFTATSKTLLACAASPVLVVDPDTQDHRHSSESSSMEAEHRRHGLGCNEMLVGNGWPAAVLQAVSSPLLCHTASLHAPPPQHDGLWSLSPGMPSLLDLLQVLKTDLCLCVPLHSDSPARS